MYVFIIQTLKWFLHCAMVPLAVDFPLIIIRLSITEDETLVGRRRDGQRKLCVTRTRWLDNKNIIICLNYNGILCQLQETSRQFFILLWVGQTLFLYSEYKKKLYIYGTYVVVLYLTKLSSGVSAVREERNMMDTPEAKWIVDHFWFTTKQSDRQTVG